MQSFRHILFPVDFSARCRAIRPAVLAMAHQFNARITLLHAIQIPVGWYGTVEGSYTALLDVPAMEQDLCGELDRFLEPTGSSDAIENVADKGDPAQCITAFSESHDVDLIMMATHGYGVFRSLLLGSVAAKVLHDAKCPVWTSAHTADPNLASRLPGESMICAIDIAPESVNLIQHATEFANQHAAKLRLVHAVGGAVASAEPHLDMDFNRFLLQAGRDGIAKLQEKAGTTLDVCIEGGNIASVVSDAARKLDADLVIIGRGRQRQTLGRLRTNAYAIIRDSPCPVLSF
jgi:nucleotide-binding universal stress UspA family protein